VLYGRIIADFRLPAGLLAVRFGLPPAILDGVGVDALGRVWFPRGGCPCTGRNRSGFARWLPQDHVSAVFIYCSVPRIPAHSGASHSAPRTPRRPPSTPGYSESATISPRHPAGGAPQNPHAWIGHSISHCYCTRYLLRVVPRGVFKRHNAVHYCACSMTLTQAATAGRKATRSGHGLGLPPAERARLLMTKAIRGKLR